MQINKLAVIIFCLLLLAGTSKTSAPAKASGELLTISAANVNIREGPGLSYPILAMVDKGEQYSIVRQEGEWILIGLHDGRQGWIAEWFTSREETGTSMTPATEGTEGSSKGTVTADSLKIRNGPGTSFPSIGSLSYGQTVEISERNGDWRKIRTSEIEGWVSSEYLHSDEPQQSGPEEDLKKSFATDHVNVRNSPSLNGEVVGRIAREEQVSVIRKERNWTEIRYNGMNAWVSSNYLTDTKEAPSVEGEAQANESRSMATVTASTLYVRDRGALDGKIVGQIAQGQEYKILEEADNWIRIEYIPGKTGWAASWFFDKKEASAEPSQSNVKNQTLTILSDGSNIREDAAVDSPVVQRANKGDRFEIQGLKGDWYQVSLDNGSYGYVAGWIVSVTGTAAQIEKPGAGTHIKNKTVVIDPGHGGRDSGTVGFSGTLEKQLTLRTAKLLYDKLKASGTDVYMTRTTDTYVALPSRAALSRSHDADAFISLHYDSILDTSVNGMTSYYYHEKNKGLSEELHAAVISRTLLNDRGVRFGDYHVLRENSHPSVLLELGYLSNLNEEMVVTSSQYQEAAANGIYEGLARYFKNN
ncbi:SH3 domain-containing protein [Mesobacillus foraminis]|uniref:N-acetylmuramoyl-L-alanine amidase n=1 Tax=Mesobacillus foraminis TaxID=279826 RepID=A0A4R2BCF9_9BACI|nr:SH3 domain-containing protein [Mesobacillus foraminis]TCN24597.1 N-acetylmuramoyl-L-alanine amidase [Mesobacillus foraminis]